MTIYEYSDMLPEQILEKVLNIKLDSPDPDFEADKFEFSPKQIAETMGICVDDKTADFEAIANGIEGTASYDKDTETFKIWVDPFLPKKRQKFILAHEIGHVVWDILPALQDKEEVKEYKEHGGTLSFRYDGNYDSQVDEQERFANDFAGRLLMPQIILRRKLQQVIKEKGKKASVVVPEMVKLFKVTEQAMVARLKSLDILKSKS